MVPHSRSISCDKIRVGFLVMEDGQHGREQTLQLAGEKILVEEGRNPTGRREYQKPAFGLEEKQTEQNCYEKQRESATASVEKSVRAEFFYGKCSS